MKGIKREFSVARTPQQNKVAERKNKTLIEAARTMLANSLLLTTFWAEAINTACYVQNRVLVTKPHNKTPYKLLIGRSPNLDFMRPFGCPVTILNTLDHLGKSERKADEGFLVGYFVNSKTFRVFNTRTRKVKENMHIKFLENKSNVTGSGLEWLFDIDSLMNYEPVTTGNQTNDDADDKDTDEVPGKRDEGVSKGSEIDDQKKTDSSTQDVNTVGPSINTANTNINTGSLNINTVGSNDPSMPSLEETSIFDDVYDDREVGAEADTNNLELLIVFSPIPITECTKTIPKKHIIRDLNLFPDKVYKVDKALYGLHQAPRAWYETLSIYLLENGFRRVTIDKTLFKKDKEIPNEFYGELTFFLGLHVKQKDDGIFISQDKYAADILKKFNFTTVKTASTPMEPNKALIKDAEAEDVPSYTKDFTSLCCEEYLQILKRTMYSPNHPTSNIEDAFSLNFPDYLPASSDYVPASPRKTYSSSSNSFGLVPLASPTFLFFHDEPYMKVLQAFYAEKSPIPPPSSTHNPQEFFLPEEFSSSKKQGHAQSSSSTSTLPQAFEIGESSPSASEAPAMTQAAIMQLVVDSVTTALEAQAATMTNALGFTEFGRKHCDVHSVSKRRGDRDVLLCNLHFWSLWLTGTFSESPFGCESLEC
nr:ribonuclease H-like domain-containing protein [Tanacetum cinerariifolium]